MLASFFAENQRIAITISPIGAANGSHLLGVGRSRPSARVALRFALLSVEPRLIVMGHPLRPVAAATLAAVALAAASIGTVLHAAPVTVNGATFDAPASCQAAGGALVCKVDEQQMELWVKRKPLAADIKPTDSLVRKMAYFNELHQSAVSGIMRATANDKSTPFTNYGKYSALGAAMAGKGVVTSPTVRFASVLQGDEVWEFMEVVAARTPALKRCRPTCSARWCCRPRRRLQRQRQNRRSRRERSSPQRLRCPPTRAHCCRSSIRSFWKLL